MQSEQGVPTNGPLSRLSDEDFQVFIRKLGTLVFNSIGACALARHQHPTDTIRDYLDIMPDDTAPEVLAKQYLKDIVSDKNVETLSKKWFRLTASELFAEYSGRLADNIQLAD